MQPGETVLIGSFEKSQKFQLEKGVVKVIRHHHNGLDGKISRAEIVLF